MAAVKECVETLQKTGVDLSGYTIPGVVEDMEAARKALGYDQINLLSMSYGTRVAQIYAYMHPDSLHRLVLIAVNTPGHFTYDPAVLDGMIEHISELCAKDASCSSRKSDFASTMYDVNHNMPKRWLFFNIDPDTVRLAAYGMFYSTTTMSVALDAYFAAGEGGMHEEQDKNNNHRGLRDVQDFQLRRQPVEAAGAQQDRADHNNAVGADKRIEGIRIQELQTGLSQLKAKDHSQSAGK